MSKIRNAKITHVSLGYSNGDVDTFTFGLTLEFDFSATVCGGFPLDYYDTEKGESCPTPGGLRCLSSIMKVVGVHNWEDLEGKYIRFIDEGLNSPVYIIGNIAKDEWCDIRVFFN